MTRTLLCSVFALAHAVAAVALAVPRVSERNGMTTVTGTDYRLSFQRETLGTELDFRAADGTWHPVASSPFRDALGLRSGRELSASALQATWAITNRADAIIVGRQAILNSVSGVVLTCDTILLDEGILVGARVESKSSGDLEGVLWFPPRLPIDDGRWTRYAYRDSDGVLHAGDVRGLAPTPAYAGMSPWGGSGDIARGLSGEEAALVLGNPGAGRSLAVIYLDWPGAWHNSHAFLQRYRAGACLLYPGFGDMRAAGRTRWAWMAALKGADPAVHGMRIRELSKLGRERTRAFEGIAPDALQSDWRPTPDFPDELRRERPVTDIREAMVYTVNEYADSDYALSLIRKTGTDVAIRGWFKWNKAHNVSRKASFAQRVRGMGALFGGGITCSALYDGENGITREQLLDMATRGPDGKLVDAWDHPGIRHGSLSCPAYLDYLFRWCREQIDAGADYLFMDEINAALRGNEGFDDYSCRGFRVFLLEAYGATRSWSHKDAGWTKSFGIDFDNAQVCPDGTMDTFAYRGYLAAKKMVQRPHDSRNPLHNAWHAFRRVRDDRVWKQLTDRIRAYAAGKGRRVLISANGIAPYVDLQVLGVWDRWWTKDGHVDLSTSQLDVWRAVVREGETVARGDVPVVFFHDWGMGTPPFPWLAVAPAERRLWMRVRGAEIHAAGGFFAFPVLGPFGCDAGRDGTVAEIARQAAFYQRHRDLYLQGRFLGSRSVTTSADGLSLAAWQSVMPGELLLHVINREAEGAAPRRRIGLTVRFPLGTPPRSVQVVSPDWEGARPGSAKGVGDGIEITLPAVDAYAVARMQFEEEPDLKRLVDPPRARPRMRWERAGRNTFHVGPDGQVADAADLNGFLHGKLHTHLRNPPTFLVNTLAPATLHVRVNSVAATGARLRCSLDGSEVRVHDLPDRDGKNDGAAREYAETVPFEIPAGKHRVTIENVGADWLTVDWYEFRGELGP